MFIYWHHDDTSYSKNKGVIKIGIGDWFLARSDSFRLLMTKLRDHVINTQVSFKKVKSKHREIDDKLENHDLRIRKLERVLNALDEPTIKIRRKRD